MAAEFVKNLDKAMEALHKRGAFLSAKHGDKLNTMTISWGNVGFEWGKPVFTVLVRQSRYTHDLIEGSGVFTVSIPTGDKLRKALGVCGSKSGRDVNKFEAAKITAKTGRSVDAPVVEGCEYVYECKVVYKHNMIPAMLDEEILKSSYGDEDFHTIYFGEIVECYTEEGNV